MHIDIWSDIACPWCYIGLARFQRVLGEFEHGESVEVRLRSFQLDPTLPESYEGTETGYLAERKGLSEDQVRQMFGQVAHAAKSEGLALDFDAVKVANSWRAHRLLHAANEADSSGVLTAQLETALFRAHFEDGESISDPEVLLRPVGDHHEPAPRFVGQECLTHGQCGDARHDVDRHPVVLQRGGFDARGVGVDAQHRGRVPVGGTVVVGGRVVEHGTHHRHGDGVGELPLPALRRGPSPPRQVTSTCLPAWVRRNSRRSATTSSLSPEAPANRCTQPDSRSTHLASNTGGPRSPRGPPMSRYLLRIEPRTAQVRVVEPERTSTSNARE